MHLLYSDYLKYHSKCFIVFKLCNECRVLLRPHLVYSISINPEKLLIGYGLIKIVNKAVNSCRLLPVVIIDKLDMYYVER